MNKLVSFACTAAIAPSIFAQTEGWLPNSDLPRVASDGGSGAGTAIGALTTWDPDGDGPLGRCLVVAGGLNMQVANAASVAYFDGDWHGLGAALSSSGGIYNCIAYREPNSQYEQIFATTGQGGLFRFTNGSWVQLNNCTSGKAMIVADLDGDGPQPPKLLVGGFCGVTVWDGISSTQLTGSTLTPSATSALTMWDPDGNGPMQPAIVIAALNGLVHGLFQWTGSNWIQIATIEDIQGRSLGNATSLAAFDSDGDGPNPSELVVCGNMANVSHSSPLTGQVAVFRNNTWQPLVPLPRTISIVNKAIVTTSSGPGPALPRLVIVGNFSSLGGVGASTIAYLTNGQWHSVVPSPIGSAVALTAWDSAPFSDSQQLCVSTSALTRPFIARLAVCDQPADILRDPADVHQRIGRTATFFVPPLGDDLSFRWYKGTTPLDEGQASTASSTLSGVYSNRLKISNLHVADAGEYRVVVSNTINSRTSGYATLTIGCPSDLNNDSVVDFFDFLAFVDAFRAAAPEADVNFDGDIDFFDYLDFISNFTTGC